jgi:predicted methyltransferase
MRPALLALTALALAVPASLPLAAPLEAKIKADEALAVVLADPRRTDDRIRDQYRHPAETLAFFKVKPGMTVVDFAPAGGWWTRILVPYLGEKGRYVGLNPDIRTANDQHKKLFGGIGDTFPAQAAGWTGFPATSIGAYNSDGVPENLKGKVDRLLIFRMMHNLWRFDMLRRELATARLLLRDDGLLGIEQHRANKKAGAGYTDGNKGYMREADVIALVEANGFELVGRSEINANKNDPANHVEGVWTLPPSLRGATDETKPKLLLIGESDRMTLLFKKRK